MGTRPCEQGCPWQAEVAHREVGAAVSRGTRPESRPWGRPPDSPGQSLHRWEPELAVPQGGR